MHWYPHGNPLDESVGLGQQKPTEEQSIIFRGADEFFFGILVASVGGVIAQIYAHHVLRRQKL